MIFNRVLIKKTSDNSSFKLKLQPYQQTRHRLLSIYSTHLLFEIASVLLVYENQVEVISHWELLVDVSHAGRQLIARQKQADGDGFSWRSRGQQQEWDQSGQKRKVRRETDIPNSPLTGAPSIISYFAMVSFSLYTLGPEPVVSRLMMSISICLILILTRRK